MDKPPIPRDVALGALLAGAARAMNLTDRMPRRFKARGWALDDRMHIATAACACMIIANEAEGRRADFPTAPIRGRVFRVPPGADDPPCWRAITPRASAQEIVDALELGDMLRPEKIVQLRAVP